MAAISAGATVFFLRFSFKTRRMKQITVMEMPMKMPKNSTSTTHTTLSLSMTFILMSRNWKQTLLWTDRESEMPYVVVASSVKFILLVISSLEVMTAVSFTLTWLLDGLEMFPRLEMNTLQYAY